MWRARVQFLWIFLITFHISTTSPPSGYTFYPDADGWLKVHETPASWRHASLTCRLEGMTIHQTVATGGYVMAPVSKQLKVVMLMAMKEANVTEALTGFIYDNEKEQYRTEEELAEKLPPIPFQPSNRRGPPGSEVLLMTVYGNFIPISWKKQFPFICYQRVQKSCGVGSDYVLDKATGQCYKVYSQPATWNGGLTWCMEDEASLLVVNSKEEASFLQKLMSYKLGKNMDRVWVGLGLWVDNVYRAVDGTPIEEIGYSKFRMNEPSNQTSEYCLSIDEAALLYDDKCMEKRNFICEKGSTEKVFIDKQIRV